MGNLPPNGPLGRSSREVRVTAGLGTTNALAAGSPPEAQGRILTRDWRKYNGRIDVVFQPKQMSVAELLAGFRYANERFYSPRSMARRLCRSPVRLCWTLPLNLAYALSWAKG